MAAAPKPAADDDDIFDLTDEMMSSPPASAIPFPQPSTAARPAPRRPEPQAEEDSSYDRFRAPREAEQEVDLEFRPMMPEPEEHEEEETTPVEAPFIQQVRSYDREQEPMQEEAEAPSLGQQRVDEPSEALLSSAAGQAVAEAFGRLTQRGPNSEGRTIEELVADMLRPMLKEWLDDNLPVLVERLVRDEIERVTRGRR
ncbi:PopZ family protein [Lutibaculum baratangense]|uniref:PopZ family protein n=1 Tax=Lutibaculum baratangense TaxID=1358440 RepID=UPI001361F831|nr:DUF2497 domain-containing protein [Lutibaculum baratangense]